MVFNPPMFECAAGLASTPIDRHVTRRGLVAALVHDNNVSQPAVVHLGIVPTSRNVRNGWKAHIKYQDRLSRQSERRPCRVASAPGGGLLSYPRRLFTGRSGRSAEFYPLSWRRAASKASLCPLELECALSIGSPPAARASTVQSDRASYIFFAPGGESTMMSGRVEDLRVAQSLRNGLEGCFMSGSEALPSRRGNPEGGNAGPCAQREPWPDNDRFLRTPE